MLAAKKIEFFLQAGDIFKLKPDRQAAHGAKIAAIISEIGVHEAQISSKRESSAKRQLSTLDESSANTAKKGRSRTPWTDSEVKCLVQARTLHTNKFQEYNKKSLNQKWDVVTDTFNNGSQQSNTVFALSTIFTLFSTPPQPSTLNPKP